MIKIPKSFLQAQIISKYIFIIISVLFAVVIYFLFSFLYNYFYEAITQADMILVLNKEVASESIDINKFENIVKNLDKKTNSAEINITKNPFE